MPFNEHTVSTQLTDECINELSYCFTDVTLLVVVDVFFISLCSSAVIFT